MTLIPPSPTGYTPASTNAEGFLLLTIPNATVVSTAPQHRIDGALTGLLSLECVTVSVSDPMERDVWLVMRVESASKTTTQSSFEWPLPATQKIILSRADTRYKIPMTEGGELILTLPPARDAAQREDLETLEVILAQYAVLQTQEDTNIAPLGSPVPGGAAPYAVDPDADLKGRLVLVDEDNGQVVGMLDDQFNVREDAGLHAEGNEKHPVIVEIPEGDDVTLSGAGTPRKVKREVLVHTIPIDDTDWMSKTAGFLGRGIVGATNIITQGVETASSYYISKSKPAAQPIVFSETTRKNIKRVHHISGQAVKVTSKTTGLIHQAVERLTDAVTGQGKNPPPSSAPSRHGLHKILTPNASGPGTPTLGRDGSKEWTTPGANPMSSASSIRSGPPPYSPTATSSQQQPPPLPPRRRFLNRLLTSTDMLLTTVETSAGHLITHATASISAAAHHKYGEEAGNAVNLVGGSVKNVAVVYVDVRGVGRRALLRVAGKRVIRAHMGGKEVVFQEQGMGRGIVVEKGAVDPTGTQGPSGDPYGPPPFPPPGASMPGGYPKA